MRHILTYPQPGRCEEQARSRPGANITMFISMYAHNGRSATTTLEPGVCAICSECFGRSDRSFGSTQPSTDALAGLRVSKQMRGLLTVTPSPRGQLPTVAIVTRPPFPGGPTDQRFVCAVTVRLPKSKRIGAIRELVRSDSAASCVGGRGCCNQGVGRANGSDPNCTARAFVATAARHAACLHVRCGMQAACRHASCAAEGGSAAGPKPGRVSFWGELGAPVLERKLLGMLNGPDRQIYVKVRPIKMILARPFDMRNL